jgi:quercetin dioxygenase-like cupin family protein
MADKATSDASQEEKMNVQEMITYSEGGIMSKKLIWNEGFNTDLFCMAAGTEISEHTAKKKAFVYVIEGKGVFVLEGEEIAMSAGVLVSMQADAVHSLKAEENTSFILTLANNNNGGAK